MAVQGRGLRASPAKMSPRDTAPYRMPCALRTASIRDHCWAVLFAERLCCQSKASMVGELLLADRQMYSSSQSLCIFAALSSGQC